MNLTEIRKIARKNDVKVVKGIKKCYIIRALQRKEGNFPCYGLAINGECDQADCMWRADCLKESRK